MTVDDDEPMTPEQAEAIAAASAEVKQAWANLARVVAVEWPPNG